MRSARRVGEAGTHPTPTDHVRWPTQTASSGESEGKNRVNSYKITYRALRARAPRQAGPRNTTQESSKFFIYKNLLDSCLRILRCLQFESATIRGPLVSDASMRWNLRLFKPFCCLLFGLPFLFLSFPPLSPPRQVFHTCGGRRSRDGPGPHGGDADRVV